MKGTKPRVLFLGLTFAGHRTRFLNLRENIHSDDRFDSAFVEITGWRNTGLLERVPLLPPSIKGALRPYWDARAYAKIPRPDVVWTSGPEYIVPYFWAHFLGDAELIVDTDASYDQMNSMAPRYFNSAPAKGIRRSLARRRERAILNKAALVLPWSSWAEQGLIAAGLDPNRSRVLPPGIDLDQWKPEPRNNPGAESPLRILFVGADFVRKGGPMLAAAAAGPLAGRIEVDVVTRDEVEPSPGLRIHRAEANSDYLRSLFHKAELFALPTTAECFGIAAVEAMAAGLPVLMGNVGGASDIVDHGSTGWLVEPELSAVVAALQLAVLERSRLREMGGNGRKKAERCFDGRANDKKLADSIVRLASNSL